MRVKTKYLLVLAIVLLFCGYAQAQQRYSRALPALETNSERIVLSKKGKVFISEETEEEFIYLLTIILEPLEFVDFRLPRNAGEVVRGDHTSIRADLQSATYFNTGSDESRQILKTVEYQWLDSAPGILVTLNDTYRMTVRKKDAQLLVRWADSQLR